MTPDLPYYIPLAAAGILIILYFFLRAWTCGILRPIVTVLSLAAGVTAGFYAHKYFEDSLLSFDFQPAPITTFAVGFLAGVVVFLLLRKTGHTVFEAIFTPETFIGRFFSGPVGAVFSLIPTILVIAGLASFLRIYATFAELRHIQTCGELHAKGQTEYPGVPSAINLRNAFEKIPHVSSYLDRVDPYSPKAKRSLAGLALISRHYDLFLRLRTHKLAVEIYTQPDVAALLADIEVTELLDAAQFRKLLTNKTVRQTASVPEITDKLVFIDIIEVLDTALGRESS